MIKKQVGHVERGFVSVITMMFVVLMSVVALSFTSLCNINLQISDNHQKVSEAQLAAESGLEYAQHLINQYISDYASKTANNTISNDDASDAYQTFVEYVQVSMEENALVTEEIGDSILFDEDGLSGDELTVPEIQYSGDKQVGFALTFRQYDDDVHMIEVISEGRAGVITRHARITYSLEKDNSLLRYAVASRSRMIVTGDSTIEVGIYSEWTDTDLAAPIELAEEALINGDINTLVSEDDYDMDDLQGSYDNIYFDQPEIDMPTADDFDTSIYADMTETLPNSGVRQTEYFPHAAGDYTSPKGWSSDRLNRTVYGPESSEDEPLVLTNAKLPSGGNSLFRNCVFEGILYIGVGNGHGTNNVRFENCVFRGPVITGVPSQFGPETWKKNVLYFTGANTFDNQVLAEATILAPNYNVNIGNTMAVEEDIENTLTGVVLGGVVDVRGNITVEGTIVSMHMPNSETWGYSASQVATNIGYSDENNEAGIPEDCGIIIINPNPDNDLPNGMSTKVIMTRNGNSYMEW